MPDQIPRLQLDHISKSFPGVQAVQDVSLTVMPGEVHPDYINNFLISLIIF